MRSMLETRATEPYVVQYLHSWMDPLRHNIQWQNVDVVLAESELGTHNIFEIIPELRSIKPNLPIILVAGQANRDTLVRAINGGVAGFVEKPVDFSTLKGLIERHRCAGFELRMNEDRKAIFSQGKWVDLTSTEYKIIETLRVAGRRMTRSELQAAVWPNSSISENNLDTHLTNLKRKIPELAACLNVKRGLGYYLEKKSD